MFFDGFSDFHHGLLDVLGVITVGVLFFKFVDWMNGVTTRLDKIIELLEEEEEEL